MRQMDAHIGVARRLFGGAPICIDGLFDPPAFFQHMSVLHPNMRQGRDEGEGVFIGAGGGGPVLPIAR